MEPWERPETLLPHSASSECDSTCCLFVAGLTLGLLSLDMNGLKILEEGGDEAEREHARLIIPIRKKGNLLLCTLLLGNTIVNAATRCEIAQLHLTSMRVTARVVGWP